MFWEVRCFPRNDREDNVPPMVERDVTEGAGSMDVSPGGVVATTEVAQFDTAHSGSRQRGLERKLCERIRRLTGRRIRGLSVAVQSGVIHIRGRCWTFYTKQLAQHAVMALNENEQVSNEIEVIAP